MKSNRTVIVETDIMENALSEKTIIELALVSDRSELSAFIIEKVLGIGASCIAYKAIDVKRKSPVVLKECFPFCGASREVNNNVIWDISSDKKTKKIDFLNLVIDNGKYSQMRLQ